MKRRKKRKTYKNLRMIKGVTATGIGIGVGSQVLSKLPGVGATSTAPIRTGLKDAAGFIGIGVNVYGAGLVLKQLKKLKKKSRGGK